MSLQEDEDNDMDVSDDNSMNSMSDNDSVGMLDGMSYFFIIPICINIGNVIPILTGYMCLTIIV